MSAFAENALLQVLFFAVLFGLALAKFGEKGPPIILDFIDHVSHIFFTIIGWIMRWHRSVRSAPWPTSSASTASVPSAATGS